MAASSPYPSITWTPGQVADSLRRVVEEHRQAVGARLRALRKDKGWSQEDAAYNVGVTLKTWGDWERGKRDPYDANWKKIGEAFEVDPADVRGTPPAPLGLGAPAESDQLAEISAKLDLILAHLEIDFESPVKPPDLAAQVARETRARRVSQRTRSAESPEVP